MKTVTSRFILVHYLQNCVLAATGKQLPKWGFEQQEVTCNLNLRDKNGYWNVEDNRHKKCKIIYHLFDNFLQFLTMEIIFMVPLK